MILTKFVLYCSLNSSLFTKHNKRMRQNPFAILLGVFAFILVFVTDVAAADVGKSPDGLKTATVDQPTFVLEVQAFTAPATEQLTVQTLEALPMQTKHEDPAQRATNGEKWHYSISTKARSCWTGCQKSNFNLFRPPGKMQTDFQSRGREPT